jgi:hypothetical protein
VKKHASAAHARSSFFTLSAKPVSHLQRMDLLYCRIWSLVVGVVWCGSGMDVQTSGIAVQKKPGGSQLTFCMPCVGVTL